LIEIILGKRNRIITASDGASAISWALDARPDLILMDLFMPRLDGFETVRILQENPDTRKIPVLALSAEMSRVNAERALEAGCVGYLGKPFDARTLRRAVTRALRNGRRVHVGVEKEIFPRRQIDDPSEDRGGGVARAHVELPNPPVDAPPGPDAFFEIGRDLRIPKPRGHSAGVR
jgi:CheY-like chemotaxis protein